MCIGKVGWGLRILGVRDTSYKILVQPVPWFMDLTMLINVCLLLLQETGGYQVPYRVLIGELERAACFVLFVSGFARGEVRR